MEGGISNYLQNQIKQAQQIEGQIEQLSNQKYQMELRIKELTKTLEELQKVGENTPIYRSVGPVLYKVDDKTKLVSELSEQKELSEIRIKTIEKQQKSLEDKYHEIEQSIQKTYQQTQKPE
ncbi:MAG: prefoldin subunit beta [Candidatus Thermoplasmatota archaeon]|jgi:prefoldin beta subunit|nr:prefoldin subunit beta [Candidatus Thermoplasmatota archaeon]